ncbi:MAG TPA: 2-oxoglutarate dehydrogenase complex dihydrolipoyllysine-residue succinyltransferase [Verrucomicrobiota bacterium]|nr:2-oxoglutarate dehydrogenase complex dihydrolipoyllysine-residue succinyltransferase [Verrucomicrobiota bacterium]HNT14946.1 2-oxoglutarate dehydrogenase complex dihydrolipoyllysine-residue succinyltransferase [Verrucomicrobiota bacterium]
MAIELKVPAVGESITEVEIGDWLKAEGATVAKDENLVVIETEKATVELPAPAAGQLTKILKPAGATAKVGETIALLAAGQGEVASVPPGATPEPAAATRARPTPLAEKVLAEHGLRADEVAGTGPGGRVSKADVLRHVQEHPPKEAVPVAVPADAPTASGGLAAPAATSPSFGREQQVVRMSLLRRTIARRLVEAQHTAALLTTFNEVDLSSILALRQQYQESFQKRYGVKLGFMSFFVKAVIDGLKQFPGLNAIIRDSDIVYHNYHDIGLAVSTDRGLVVPVLRDADRLSFAEIERAIMEFAQRARDGKIRPEELEGGTFTITNGGVFGSLLSTPLVNPPQSGILGMHAIQERPVAVNGQVVVRPMMYVALTYDHRIVDGKEAVLFLRRVKDGVENPARLLLEV